MTTSPAPGRLLPTRVRRWEIALLLATALCLLAALLYPIRFTAIRLLIIACQFMLWAGILHMGWHIRPVKMFCIAVAIIFFYFVAAPGRATDKAALRNAYLTSLRSYEGSTYLWGGECRRGIDCSGLLRRGFIDANLRRGLTTLNPALVRVALDLWLRDSSAKAMGEEYRGRTRSLLDAKSLNDVDYSRLLPGDIAVTQSGVHTLAYLGDREWIQADPGAWKVVIDSAPSTNAWFSQRMKILRWRELDTRS